MNPMISHYCDCQRGRTSANGGLGTTTTMVPHTVAWITGETEERTIGPPTLKQWSAGDSQKTGNYVLEGTVVCRSCGKPKQAVVSKPYRP